MLCCTGKQMVPDIAALRGNYAELGALASSDKKCNKQFRLSLAEISIAPRDLTLEFRN